MYRLISDSSSFKDFQKKVTSCMIDLQKRLVEGMRQLFPDTPILRVKILYEDEVRRYLKKTEIAYKKAAKSKLRFGACEVV